MKTIELLINYKTADIQDEIRIVLNKVVSELRNPTKKTGAYSLPVTLPLTANNCALFNNIQDKQMVGKFQGKSYVAQLLIDDQIVIDGEFLLQSLDNGFQGAVVATKSVARIGDLLGEKKLQEIKSFTPLDFQGNQSIVDSWNTQELWNNSEVCYPFVLRSLAYREPQMKANYESLGVSHFWKAILLNMFRDIGYEVEGDILSDVTFQKLFLLYSNPEAQADYNFGSIAEGDAIFSTERDYTLTTIERRFPTPNNAETIFIFEGSIVNPFTGAMNKTGDIANQLDRYGVFTCKQSGEYEITFNFSPDLKYRSVGDGSYDLSRAITHKKITLFREITDKEYLESSDFNQYDTFEQTPFLTKEGVKAVGNGTHTVLLEEGKQYRIQSYHCAYWSVPDRDRPEFYPQPGAIYQFQFSAGDDAPKLLNPALFLPDMKQLDFLQDFQKLFNQYSEIDETAKVVRFYSRTSFFQRNQDTLLDISPYFNLDTTKETPLTRQDVSSLYMQYATDESDYILNRTDYLQRVNGEVDKESYQLHVAPLAFLEVTLEDGVIDMIPAILPDTDSVNDTVLTDIDLNTPGGSWVPRIGLYHGAEVWKPGVLHLNSREGMYADFGGQIGNFRPIPKVGFFDTRNQPVYRVVENTQLRSFSLALSDRVNIYSPVNLTYISTPEMVDSMNVDSLATAIGNDNPEGLFFRLYKDDILINNLSNYFEGTGLMNAQLFKQLTGRQILKLNDDLFLLESISNFEIASNTATYKIYKMISS